MEKREFLKSLAAVGVASLLPVSVFSKVAEDKRTATINGIPVELEDFEVFMVCTQTKSNLSPTKIVYDSIYSLETKFKTKRRLYHNVGNELKIKHLYSAYGYSSVMEVSGKISKIFIDKDDTYIELSYCFGRMRMPEVQHINA